MITGLKVNIYTPSSKECFIFRPIFPEDVATMVTAESTMSLPRADSDYSRVWDAPSPKPIAINPHVMWTLMQAKLSIFQLFWAIMLIPTVIFFPIVRMIAKKEWGLWAVEPMIQTLKSPRPLRRIAARMLMRHYHTVPPHAHSIQRWRRHAYLASNARKHN